MNIFPLIAVGTCTKRTWSDYDEILDVRYDIIKFHDESVEGPIPRVTDHFGLDQKFSTYEDLEVAHNRTINSSEKEMYFFAEKAQKNTQTTRHITTNK